MHFERGKTMPGTLILTRVKDRVRVRARDINFPT
jgi:hypothetical protein